MQMSCARRMRVLIRGASPDLNRGWSELKRNQDQIKQKRHLRPRLNIINQPNFATRKKDSNE